MRRRTILIGFLAIGTAAIATLEFLPRTRKRLLIDPEGIRFIYEEGWIVTR